MQSEVAELGTMNAPNTDQLNADDLIAGPRIFTLVKITKGKGSGSGKGDQPINIHLAEHPYPWRPCKTVRRLLMDAWGPKPGEWPEGAQVELYRDTAVRFGGDTVGGIRVRAMSHIKAARLEHLSTATRGQRVTWVITRLEGLRAGKQAPDVQTSIDTAVRLFGEAGVPLDELEMQIGSPREQWGADELKQLRADYSARRKAKNAPTQPNPTNTGELTQRERLIDLLEQYADGQPLAAFLGNRFGVGKPVDRLTEDDLRGFVKQLQGGAK